MTITHADIGGDENTARRVLALARTIAPIGSLDRTSEVGKDAIAVLKGVLAELPAAGSARVRSQSRNGTSVSLADLQSAFSSDARASLRALCGVATMGLPVGDFPQDRPVSGLWPEAS